MSAIVAALAVATSAALTGCGQRGPLYLPSVPPLPEKPVIRTAPEAPAGSTGSQGEIDSSGNDAHAPLTLAPADSLGSTPHAGSQAAPAAASSAAPDQ
jgi:predicted small lipoprotein YifL